MGTAAPSYYYTVEELETEATFASINQSNICPIRIAYSSHLNIGVAFDNFHRLGETSLGNDTLHDTAGIIFQKHNGCSAREIGIDATLIDPVMSQTLATLDFKNKRFFEAIISDLVKRSEVLLGNYFELRQFIVDNLNYIKELGLLWMISLAFKVSNTSMWVGFNSQILLNKTVSQKVIYLTPINVSPIQSSVVIETLKQSQNVAEVIHNI